MALGVLFGLIFREQATLFEPLGVVFLKLVRMLVVPLIFFTLIYGITNLENTGELKRVGLKAIGLFLATAFLAVALGIGVATLLKPGLGQMLSLVPQGPPPEAFSLKRFLIELIPDNALLSMVQGNILQVILLAFFVGFTLQRRRKHCATLISVCRQGAEVCFTMIGSIMQLAPIGVFAYIYFVVGTQGLQVLFVLGKLIVTILIACALQYAFFGVLIFWLGRLSPWPFYKKMLPAQLLAFSTSSSKAVLTLLMDTAEKDLGVSPSHSRFLIPMAAALNMDGGAIYQGACAVFFAQVFGLHLTLLHYVLLLFMCTLASIGGAGIPGGVLLFLGMVLSAIGLPIEGVLLIATVDRILDMVTTTINVTGDVCATVIIDRSENTLDVGRYYKR